MASVNQPDATVSIASDLTAALVRLEERELLPIVAEGLSTARATSNRCSAEEVLCRLSPNNLTTHTRLREPSKTSLASLGPLLQPTSDGRGSTTYRDE
jgi:hypothetical protein